MACSGICCAKCCTIFSFIGLIFLIIIASLLQTQPLYIKGPTDAGKAAAGCYQGALIYLGTFILSVTYWLFDNARRKVSAVLKGEPKSPVGKYTPVQNDNL